MRSMSEGLEVRRRNFRRRSSSSLMSPSPRRLVSLLPRRMPHLYSVTQSSFLPFMAGKPSPWSPSRDQVPPSLSSASPPAAHPRLRLSVNKELRTRPAMSLCIFSPSLFPESRSNWSRAHRRRHGRGWNLLPRARAQPSFYPSASLKLACPLGFDSKVIRAGIPWFPVFPPSAAEELAAGDPPLIGMVHIFVVGLT